MDETFYGYCFLEKNGHYYPAVSLKGPQEVYNYISLHRMSFPEIRITDRCDSLVVHVLDAKIIFPPEWVNM